MSLYGALFGGVSGLRAQSSKIGIISDNIANVNTIGYKQGQATFSTLVVNSNSNVSYTTGGVRGGSRMNVDKQGLLSSTESPTDIAMSGKGFFVVRSTANATSGVSTTPLFTRAGSFRQDETGNFVNSQGFYLQGWPLDREGRLPGEAGNLNTTSFANFDSLVNVNVETVSGISQATTTVKLGANLDAGEEVFPGSSGVVRLDLNTPNNLGLAADDVIVGADYGLATADSLRRGDRFDISTGNGLQYTYEYGGFTIGRQSSVTGGANNMGDNGVNNTALTQLNTAGSIVATGTHSFEITIPNHGMISGDTLTLSGFMGAVGGVPATQLNANHTVTYVDANTVSISMPPAYPHGFASGTAVGPGGILADSRQYAGNIFDAVSSSQAFLAQIGVTDFSAAALTFNISTASAGTRTFKYTTSSPNAAAGEFNSLVSLANAIDAVSGLTARVVDNRLVVGAEDAAEEVTFSNGDAAGTPLTVPPKRGIDWISELGFQNIPIGTRRFSNLDGLSKLVGADEGVSATISNPLNNATLEINVDDPLDTIQFADLTNSPIPIPTAGTPIAIPPTLAGNSIDITINTAPAAYMTVGDNAYVSGLTNGIGGLPGNLPNGGPFEIVATTAGSYTIRIPAQFITQDVGGGSFNGTVAASVSVAGKSNQGSVLSALGLTPSLNGNPYTPQSTAVLGPRYDSSGSIGGNMASGDITAQFSRNVRIYDALGSGHDIRYSFIKVATNEWIVEVHAIPEDDVNTPLVDGQIAVGSISFNGDGSLRSLSAALTDPVTISWRNGAEPSTISLNFGTAGQPFGTPGATTIGLTDGLSQFDSSYNVAFANQNGAPVGELVSVSITEQGIVVASYSNGETQDLFQLPVADFPNPDGLRAITGNVYAQSRDSGEVNLRIAGTNGTGTIVSAALEQSNVDLAEQLTDMIVAQRSYQANTRVIRTTDELLDQLNQI